MFNTALNNALNRGNSNEISAMCSPDYSAALSGVGNAYTAPCDGIFYFSLSNTNASVSIAIDDALLVAVYNGYGTAGGTPIQLAKGSKIVVGSLSTTLAHSYFIPMKGAE